MSLISDALKTAQRERTERVGRRADQQAVEGFFPYPERAKQGMPRTTLVVGGAAVLVILLAGFVVSKVRHGSAKLPVPSPMPSLTASASRPPSPRSGAPTADASAGAAKPNASSPSAAAPSVGQTHQVLAQQAGTVAERPAASSHSASTGAAAPQRGASDAAGAGSAVPSAAGATKLASVARDSAAAPVAPAPAPAPSSVPANTTASPVQITVDVTNQRPVDALMTQALEAQRQGNRERAKQLYDQAIKIGPTTAPLYSNYGALLVEMGNQSNAVGILRLAISLDPSFVDAWVNLGNAQDALGDHAAATSSYSQALKLDPLNSATKVNLARQYLDLGAYIDARRAAQDVTHADPRYALAHYVLAQALEGLHETSGAIEEFTKFLELGGGSLQPGLEAKVRAHLSSLKAVP